MLLLLGKSSDAALHYSQYGARELFQFDDTYTSIVPNLWSINMTLNVTLIVTLNVNINVTLNLALNMNLSITANMTLNITLNILCI